ncbi:efflux RND transporter permease subunit [Portibacter lacus]|uniref:Multidrug resistance protein n=1 Tax=Portibacter lacus TaxID=1099794 RepID=A0AA37WFG4_9BACT|nr:efflux RND transporter permease subunit [Portibacter lacus]GLR16980.1 multidrug resistance protein [Portibacter lacus]
MNLSSLNIDRPVLSSVLSIVIIIFGFIGFSYLGVREYPSVDPPIISVVANYPGANADVMESQVTEPLEESINGISGIRTISSVSADGRSTVTVEFELDVDLEAAANDVRDRVSRAIRSLPPDIETPIVNKADADATTIMALTLQSNNRSLLELTDMADKLFKERLQTVQGIANIRIWGSKVYSMRLNLDPSKMSSLQIAPNDVRLALQRENVELPTGKIEGYRQELTIRTFGRLESEEDFNNLIISEKEGSIIRLKDIGVARIEAQNKRTLLRGKGIIPMVGVAITPQPGANYIEIADDIYDRVSRIEKEMPEDVKVGYAFDNTEPIRAAIEEVKNTIFIAFSLVVFVIFAFLRDWRTTIIPVLVMPISLIGTFFILYVMDYSINILTLLGIVLSTGLVVDDAIVMLENIYQKIEKGMEPLKAAHEGAKEIFFAIIATSVTLIAVFMPVIFLSGLSGRLFREFGFVVGGAIVISTFVSLTLTPMLASRMLKKREKHNKFYNVTERFFVAMTNGYRKSLAWFIKAKWLSPLLILLAFVAIYFVVQVIPTELAPKEDKGAFRVIATAPEGTSYELMDEYMVELLQILDTIPERKAYISVTSPGFGSSTSVNSGFVFMNLTPPTERERSQSEIVESVFPLISSKNFARSFIVEPETIEVTRSRGGLPVQYVIQAPTLEKLKEIIPSFIKKAEDNGAFSVVDINLKFTKPELTVTIDRDKARTLGISVQDVAETLQLLFASQRYGYFIRDGKQYEVIGEADRPYRDAPLDLSQASVRAENGQLIKLSEVINMEETSSPPQLYRYNRYVSATINAGLNDGFTVGMGIEEMDKIADELLDESFSTSLSGSSKELQESSSGLYFAFGLALILVFLTLAAQFESYIDPIIIMVTVPLALLGALLTLYFYGQTLNIFSQIGIIVLIGIVTKNGILIVEFANQKLLTSKTKAEAILDASASRLRPILMTSLATVLGTLPIALAIGSASTSRIPMGLAIIGGLLFSLILTLYIIPSMYLLISRKKPQIKE